MVNKRKFWIEVSKLPADAPSHAAKSAIGKHQGWRKVLPKVVTASKRCPHELETLFRIERFGCRAIPLAAVERYGGLDEMRNDIETVNNVMTLPVEPNSSLMIKHCEFELISFFNYIEIVRLL